ncbi:hypothetical protein [Pinirhizobacter sp.]|jgi:hypothetical protein|uniref:hypothetical protein n=1 Tax=Pinirhizobacter sp. TaxID=2950432 RepID=UPI002F42206D
MRLLLSVLFVALSFTATVHAKDVPVDTHAADRAQIQQVVDSFKAAIIAKNGKAMSGMFLSGGSWLMAVDKASVAKIRTRHPEAKQFVPGSYEEFAGFVGSAPRPIEEVFSNVSIQTDGIVGTVYFDYRFLVDGKATNHGAETWQLVHTDEGWKISAMLYSAIMDDKG